MAIGTGIEVQVKIAATSEIDPLQFGEKWRTSPTTSTERLI